MLEYVRLNNCGELDTFAASHINGHFMQTSLWGRFKTIGSGWEWHGIVCKSRTGKIKGTMALLVRHVRFTHSCLFYAPRGPVFDHDDIKTFRELLTGARSLADKMGAYMLRIDPPVTEDETKIVAEIQKCGFKINGKSDFSTFQARNNYILPIGGMSEDEVFNSFHSKTRYNIKVAVKKGVSVRICGADKAAVFDRLVSSSGKRDGFSSYGADFYSLLLNSMGSKARLYLAYVGDTAVAGAIAINDGRKTWYMYGGSSGEYRNYMPNYLIQWSMIRWAIEKGSEIYDFRGVVGLPDESNRYFGLHRYKQGFGALFVSYLGQMDLCYKPVMKLLINLGQKLLKLRRK